MTRKISTATTTQLGHLSGIPAADVEPILAAAGVRPVSEVVRKNGTFRTWPRAEAMKALRASEQYIVKLASDRVAGDRAALIDIKAALDAGTMIPVADYRNWITSYTNALSSILRKTIPGFAAEIAAVNARALPDLERRAEIRALFDPTITYLKSLRENAPWQQN